MELDGELFGTGEASRMGKVADIEMCASHFARGAPRLFLLSIIFSKFSQWESLDTTP